MCESLPWSSWLIFWEVPIFSAGERWWVMFTLGCWRLWSWIRKGFRVSAFSTYFIPACCHLLGCLLPGSLEYFWFHVCRHSPYLLGMLCNGLMLWFYGLSVNYLGFSLVIPVLDFSRLFRLYSGLFFINSLLLCPSGCLGLAFLLSKLFLIRLLLLYQHVLLVI